MGLKKDINHNSPKCSTLVHEHRYLFIHILECVFILLILYCVLCECGVIGESWNITSCGFYERLESWFQQTKYTYNTINTSVETASESLNIDGEIVIETTASGNHTLDVMNQIIMILLPLMVTLIALSFALLPKKIYGVRYADLRRLALNRAYSFLSMIIISIVLFICCITFYYLDFVLCTIVIDFIALVYIVLFLCLEIPLLSQSPRRINHIIKNAINYEYTHQNDGKRKNDNKQITNNFIYNEINDRGIYDVYFDCYKRTNKHSQKEANLLLNIYVKKIEDEYPYVSREERRRLVSNFCNNYIDYLEILATLNINFSDESRKFVDNESCLLSTFIQNYVSFDDENEKNSFEKLFSFLTTYASCPHPAKQTHSLSWLYSPVDLHKIAITNALLIYACCYGNIKYLSLFANFYFLNVDKPIIERPNYQYLIFFTIYFFNFAQNNDKSQKLSNLYTELFPISKYKEVIKTIAGFYESTNANQSVMLLRSLLDFYKTLPEKANSPFGFHDYINWETIPPILLRVEEFVPFTKDDIYSWWISLILLLPFSDTKNLENEIKFVLNDDDIKSLLNVYLREWVDQNGNFQSISRFDSYFAALDIAVSVTEDRKKEIQEIFTNLTSFETTSVKTSTTEKSEKSEDESLVKEREIKTEIYNEIKDYVNEHTKNQEFYSSEPSKYVFMKNYEITFSREGTIIDGFNSPHDAFWLLFDENGYQNVHSIYLQEYTDAYFNKFKKSPNVKDISEYKKETNEDILRFKPDKKYAPRSLWLRDEQDGNTQSSYQEILNIKNTKTNLIEDMYLQNGAIKFYIKCCYVSNYLVLDKEKLRVMIRKGDINYKKTHDGKYKYRTSTLQGNFTEDELVNLLAGNIRTVTVTMEYGITYDESKMLVYRIK